MTRIRTTLVLTAALAAIALAPGSATAATTCAHDAGGVLTVTMSAHGDQAIMKLGASGTDIQVSGFGPVACTGTAPSLFNTDTVLVLDQSDDPSTPAGNDGGTLVSILEPAYFAPGKTPEAGGISEIEFLADTKGGYDRLALGGAAKQQITVGNDGAGWDADADGDLLGMPFDDLYLYGGDPADYLNASGGTGTGAPLSTAAALEIYGGGGDDSLTGSPGRDRIIGGAGKDSVGAFAGDDIVSPGPGDDTVQGGQGDDTLNFNDADGGVSVDLSETQQQDTRQGLDQFGGEFENVTGSSFADTLSGNFAANVLRGDKGDDVLDGRPGADELHGEEGSDTASYATSEAGVNVDLAQTSQPTDNDKFFGIDNLIGSPLADTLAGNAGPNRIEARDGVGDRVSCGGGADTAITDRRSVDAVAADCDTVDALPEAPAPPAGRPAGQGAPPVADRALSFSLAGARRQRVLRQRGVRVKVRCPLESCSTTATASGSFRAARSTRRKTTLRLRPVRTRLAAGSTRTVTLRLTRRQRVVLRRAFAAGQRPRITVAVTVTDGAGNRVRRSLPVSTRP